MKPPRYPRVPIMFVDDAGLRYAGYTNERFVASFTTTKTIVAVEVDGLPVAMSNLPQRLFPGESMTVPLELTDT